MDVFGEFFEVGICILLLGMCRPLGSSRIVKGVAVPLKDLKLVLVVICLCLEALLHLLVSL